MSIKLIVLLLLGVWLGMILGISFLEAPLKFQAPNITLTLGLGIGKVVFSALNKVEIFFSIFLLSVLFLKFQHLDILTISILSFLTLLVSLQTFWLLPILNTRVDGLLKGVMIAKSNHHLFYVIFEILKVGLLILGFARIYKS